MAVLAFVNSSIQYEYTKTEQFLWFAINPASAQHFSHQGYAIVHYLSSSTEHSNLERDRKKLCVLLQFQTRRWIDLANLMFGTRCAKFKPEQKNEDAQDKQQISCFLEKVQKCFFFEKIWCGNASPEKTYNPDMLCLPLFFCMTQVRKSLPAS